MKALAVEEYLKKPYTRIVTPDENGGFCAEILEFPGCFAEGDTAQEAYNNLERTAASWIEAAFEKGQEIPEPSTNQGYAGKIALRLPRSIHKRAAKMAARDETSLNQFLLSSIATRIGAEEFYEKLLQKIQRELCISVQFSMNWAVLQIGQTSGEINPTFQENKLSERDHVGSH